jgi:HAE1 family hydrophobic/amphiphilic exporter-1/multidrug efflux pump
MRIWLDPAKLQKYALMPSDVTSALEAQNTEVSPASSVRCRPARPAAQRHHHRAQQAATPESSATSCQVTADGSLVTSDVARVELGGESYGGLAANGKPSAALAIQLATGANALATAEAVKQKLAELEPYFPASMKLKTMSPTTPRPSCMSIEEVVKTLIEAIVLVVLMMYLFLQNLRAT